MNKLTFCVLFLLLLTTLISPVCTAGQKKNAGSLSDRVKGKWDDDPIEEAIKKGIEYLRSKQGADGSFDYKHGSHLLKTPSGYKNTPAIIKMLGGTLQLPLEKAESSVGASALAVYAMLKADVDIKDSTIQKGMQFITSTDCRNVYAIGVRCNTYAEAEKHARGKHMKFMQHDARRLIYSINKDTGGWNYDILDGNDFHNSPSQYGILGIWGYQMLSGEIPSNFWPLAWKYWVKGQNSDGGWSYSPPFRPGNQGADRLSSVGSMSAAGLASLFVINDAINYGKYAACKGGEYPASIVKGLQWFDKEFTNTMTGRTKPSMIGGYFCYYLYGVERVGRAAGYKYFGNQDWYKARGG